MIAKSNPFNRSFESGQRAKINKHMLWFWKSWGATLLPKRRSIAFWWHTRS